MDLLALHLAPEILYRRIARPKIQVWAALMTISEATVTCTWNARSVTNVESERASNIGEKQMHSPEAVEYDK